MQHGRAVHCRPDGRAGIPQDAALGEQAAAVHEEQFVDVVVQDRVEGEPCIDALRVRDQHAAAGTGAIAHEHIALELKNAFTEGHGHGNLAIDVVVLQKQRALDAEGTARIASTVLDIADTSAGTARGGLVACFVVGDEGTGKAGAGQRTVAVGGMADQPLHLVARIERAALAVGDVASDQRIAKIDVDDRSGAVPDMDGAAMVGLVVQQKGRELVDTGWRGDVDATEQTVDRATEALVAGEGFLTGDIGGHDDRRIDVRICRRIQMQ